MDGFAWDSFEWQGECECMFICTHLDHHISKNFISQIPNKLVTLLLCVVLKYCSAVMKKKKSYNLIVSLHDQISSFPFNFFLN